MKPYRVIWQDFNEDFHVKQFDTQEQAETFAISALKSPVEYELEDDDPVVLVVKVVSQIVLQPQVVKID